MFTVYILKNSLTGRHYIGSTNNLVKRVSEHNRGHTRSTRQKGQWEIIYKEHYDELLPARRRERQIKSYKGGNGLKKLLMRDSYSGNTSPSQGGVEGPIPLSRSE